MNKIYKVFAVALVVFTIGMSKANAQHEVKANIVGPIVRSFGASYEYILDENMGILISGAYWQFTGSSAFGLVTPPEYIGFLVTPEFRYYFNPKNEDATGFFASGYLRYRNMKVNVELGHPLVDLYDPMPGYKESSNGLGIGLTIGYKFVTDFGLVLELGGGYGHFVIEKGNVDASRLIPGDPRYFLNVGYRF